MNSIDYSKDKAYLLDAIKEAYDTVKPVDTLSLPDRDIDSYYVNRTAGKNTGIDTFGFENLRELEAVLKELWKDEPEYGKKVIRAVSVAAFKHKPAAESSPREQAVYETDNPLAVSGDVYQF